MPRASKPTATELKAAAELTVPDLLAPRLRILFCGINPSLYSAALGQHFARPGNRFWPTLSQAGITPHLFRPDEQAALLGVGVGITNLVGRATATAAELAKEDLLAGRELLEKKVQRYQPHAVVFLGIGAYRAAFALPKAAMGRQSQDLAGAQVWVLNNPSGLNAHYRIDATAKQMAAIYAGSHASRHRPSQYRVNFP